jgi:hypothetical protein
LYISNATLVLYAYIHMAVTLQKDTAALWCDKHVLTNDFELHKYTGWRVCGHLTLVPAGVAWLHVFYLESPVLKPSNELGLASKYEQYNILWSKAVERYRISPTFRFLACLIAVVNSGAEYGEYIHHSHSHKNLKSIWRFNRLSRQFPLHLSVYDIEEGMFKTWRRWNSFKKGQDASVLTLWFPWNCSKWFCEKKKKG